ncbi:MAG: hypothetical protein HLUCCA12_06540 [Rhodobacteraceae bacterium HLUCCA12]|nr:MAG: hypothetical protein HLUCCA12_06540 [Rhodobacteraceae bacterium HLUCCA12]
MTIAASELVTMRDALIRARARGVRETTVDGMRVSYATDAEMAAVIADLERRINAASAPSRGTVHFSTSKGV